MQLIAGLRRGAAAEVVTLATAWKEAEGIGRVEVDQAWTGPRLYKVSIRFDSGPSSVTAVGAHTEILDAVLGAIAEARRLGYLEPVYA